MPRWIPQDALAINKRIAERLFLKVYDLELELENKSKIWAYRKAAWAADEMGDSIEKIYEQEGLSGLGKIPYVGQHIALEIEGYLRHCGAKRY